MTTKDLLSDDDKDKLGQTLQAALDVQKLVRKLVDAGMPFNEHLTKANEQVEFLSRTIELLGH
jgi:hypothetical protein